ncbi:inositol monophosphatase [Candidatus Woesearchaeota archaeon]|nr:inositol monophosphatase [Candidatus Woesearchaeota archaeon]
MSEFLDVAIDAAKKAGEIHKKYFQHQVEIEVKEDKSLVSTADKESEAVIIETIKATFPDHAFFGEETGKSGDSEYTWVIDPLDGTHHFLRGIDHFSVLIALMKGDEVIMGVSYDALRDHLMTCEKGKGVTIDGETAKLSQETDIAKSILTFEWLKGFTRVDKDQQVWQLIKDSFSTTILDAREEYQAVLTGKVEAMMGGGLGFYDFAPYVVMIEELGGKVTDMNGKKVGPDSTSFLIANKALHAQLVEQLR